MLYAVNCFQSTLIPRDRSFMSTLKDRFAKLGVESAPGQESSGGIDSTYLNRIQRGTKLEGLPVDFSHGDVDAFPPVPSSIDNFVDGVRCGGAQAYTPYKG